MNFDLTTLNGDYPTRLLIDNLPAGDWEYSLDDGVSWRVGDGSSLVLPDGNYAPEAIQIRSDGAFPKALNFQQAVVDYGYSVSDFSAVVEAYANGQSAFVPDLDTYHMAGFNQVTLPEKGFVNALLNSAEKGQPPQL